MISKSTYIWGGWTAWEDEFQNPNSPAVRKFAEEYADRIRFKYLQFEADRQAETGFGRRCRVRVESRSLS